MFLDLEITAAGPVEVPPEWATYVAATRDGLRVTGDRTGGIEVFLYSGESLVVVATSLGGLLHRLAERGIAPPLSAFGISSLLHHGFVALPHCEYEDIYQLSMGDIADVAWHGGSPSVEFSYDYPWLARKSRNDSVPSEETLLQLLTKATEAKVAEADSNGFLMLSSGKDSVAVALAMAEAGFKHIPAYTFSSGAEDPEPPVAAEVCAKLGLDHLAVEMPTAPAEIAATLTRFFEASPRPGVDLSQIPYAFSTAAAATTTGAVFDGGGNDSYMGSPMRGKWLAKMRLRIRGKTLVNAAQKLVSVDSPATYVARSRPEATFPGRNMRFHESRSFMPDAVDTRPYWRKVERDTKDLDSIDFFGAVSYRHFGTGSSTKKHVLAANAFNLDASLPWCDDDIADYYFNLPEQHRYSRKTGTSKVLLRKMLLHYLDYDASVVGKHYFGFNGAQFVTENKAYIRSEIDACALWDKSGLALVHNWLDKVGSRPMLYHSILTTFMVSGWHNHSRFVNQPSLQTMDPSSGDA